MKDRALALSMLGALVLAAAGGAIFASSAREDEPVAVAPSATAAPVGPSATVTAEPTREALRELPAAVWTPIEPEETEEAADGNMFLLDLETGQLYQPTAEVLTHRGGVAGNISWAGNGWLRVTIHGTGLNDFLKDQSDEYAGKGVGELGKLPSSGRRSRNAMSSRGVLAYTVDDGFVVFDIPRDEVIAEVPVPGADVESWSADGRFLSVVVSETSRESPRGERLTWIWDLEPASFVDEVESDGVVWVRESNQYRYLNGGVRLRDPLTHEEREVDGPLDEELWSPGLRYAVTPQLDPDSGDYVRYAFRVHDVETGEDVLALRGIFFGAWLDEDTLAFTGNACGSQGFFTVDADGSNLKERLNFGTPQVIAHPSRQGDRVGYSMYDLDLDAFVTSVVDLETGETREYETGDAVLPPYPGQGYYYWSPDGGYLALIKPGGRDGVCFTQEPQELKVEVP